MSRPNRTVVLGLILAVLIAGCGQAAPSATPSATPKATPSDTPSASAVFSATASPDLSPTPSATPTTTPSPEPSPSAYPTGLLPASSGSAPYIQHGSRDFPVIAITVDDCFSSSAVAADLAIFEKYQVNATWFPIGHVAAIYPDLWRSVDAAGFPIANHTYDHQNLTTKTYAQVLADIESDNDTLTAIIGHPITPFVRPYGGSLNGTVLAAAGAAGERAVVNWDTSDGDTSGSFADWSNVARLISLGEQGHNGSIILMHANHQYTTAALPAIITYYRSHGYQFVTLGQLLGVPGPVPYGPEPADWVPPADPTPSPLPTSTPPMI